MKPNGEHVRRRPRERCVRVKVTSLKAPGRAHRQNAPKWTKTNGRRPVASQGGAGKDIRSNTHLLSKQERVPTPPSTTNNGIQTLQSARQVPTNNGMQTLQSALHAARSSLEQMQRRLERQQAAQQSTQAEFLAVQQRLLTAETALLEEQSKNKDLQDDKEHLAASHAVELERSCIQEVRATRAEAEVARLCAARAEQTCDEEAFSRRYCAERMLRRIVGMFAGGVLGRCLAVWGANLKEAMQV